MKILSPVVSGCLFGVLHLAMSLNLTAGAESAVNDPYLDEQFELPNGGKVVLKTSGGSINVSGSKGSTVSVRVFVKPGIMGNSAAYDKFEKNYEISIVQTGDRVEAIAVRRSGRWSGSSVQVSFEVEIPDHVDCSMQTSGGSLSLKRALGKNHVLKTSGGSIHLENVTGDVHASTSGGNIQLSRIVGLVDAHTSGGNIDVSDVDGDLEATTSGGSIRVTAHRGSLKASTSGGNVSAMVIAFGSSVDLRTSGGNVSADLPGGQGLKLDLRGNRVNADIDGTGFMGTRDKNKIVGTLGNGGVPVKLTTSGGSVRLAFH